MRVSKVHVRTALAAVLILTAVLIHRGMESEKHYSQRYGIVPEPELAKLLSLGFHALASDLFWIEALQVVGGAESGELFGSLASHQTPEVSAFTRHFGQLIDVVTTLNPWVGSPYRAGAVYLVDTEQSVRKSNLLLERAIQYHPEDWRNYFYLGFNCFYYLEENERAAEMIEKAARLPDSPSYLPRLASRLRMEVGDSLEIAESFLHEMYAGSSGDERAEAQYETALREIRTEQLARLLDVAREEFKQRNGRDIQSVDELVKEPNPVLAALPEEPNGRGWTLQRGTGEIVSKKYKARYEIFGKERQRKMRAKRRALYQGTEKDEG